MNNKQIVDFIFELGQLQRIKHEGWRIAGIKDPESVADHSLNAAQIAFILAKMERYKNPYEACSMVVFHDIGECRIGDIHKVANRYIQADERRAVKEQTENLDDIGTQIFDMWEQVDDKISTAGIIAKDADLLEMAFRAKEFIETGHDFANDWIVNISRRLQTESAKIILEEIKKSNSNNWWQGLKKL